VESILTQQKLTEALMEDLKVGFTSYTKDQIGTVSIPLFDWEERRKIIDYFLCKEILV